MATVLVQAPYHLGRRDVGLATGVPVLDARLATELGRNGLDGTLGF